MSEFEIQIRPSPKDWLKSGPPRRILRPVETDHSKKPSFEAAIAKLEAIVESMEDGQVPLAELLTKFEDGSRLLKICEARLKEAEMKIELLKKEKSGATLTAFETGRGDA